MDLRFIVNAAVGAESVRHEDLEDGEGYANCLTFMNQFTRRPMSGGRKMDLWHLVKDKRKVHG